MEQRIIKTLTELAKCPITPGGCDRCRECQFRNYISSDNCKSAMFEYYMNCPVQPVADLNVNPLDTQEQKIIDTLALVGIPAHLKGYIYIKTAISAVIDNPEIIHCMCKGLYTDVAKIFGTNPSQVERAIRHAIEVGWDRGDIDVQHKLFGNSVDPNKGKPTNSEFIGTIANRLRAELYKMGE